ncbi:MAG: molybdopterin-dependent oxidoreductase [Firmicutes bacterium]|nr:molybdopterin-dependent oxidoreductase [Bacillota bacterium]
MTDSDLKILIIAFYQVEWLVIILKYYKTVCPLDCWDQCALIVGLEKGIVVSIGADPDQPITGRSVCAKGKKHIERIYRQDRLRYPLLKNKGNFERTSWHSALQLMKEKIGESLAKAGPLSLLHYYDGGYGGLLKNIESRFFSALGGCTVHRGSLCWAAGLAAQRYDFGDVLSHHHEDLLNSRLVIIWGRNPADTQIHLLPYIRKARENGARVILIDPVRTASAVFAHEYIRIKPAADGALALGMAREIIKNGMADHNFIEDFSYGFEQFAGLCEKFTPEKTAEITGLSAKQVIELARAYASSKPAAILIGIGMQRHSNGGSTVRAIDALAAITGNIGINGGGASYVNFRVTNLIDHAFLKGDDLNSNRRYYPKPKFAAALTDLTDPPIEFTYISRANPLVQVGDSGSLCRAFKKIPFIVTAEQFMTDTAAASDLVLPVTGFLEAEDIFFNSMSHQYIAYAPKVIDPPGECRPEYEYLKELADLLDINDFIEAEPGRLLEKSIKPLSEEKGITVDDLKSKGPIIPIGFDSVPWADKIFKTDNGRYNFYSKKAEIDGASGLPEYIKPFELSDSILIAQGFKYWFVTPHARESIHSTHRLPRNDHQPEAYIHPETAEEEGLINGVLISVSTKRGSIKLKVKVSDRVPPNTVLVYEGWWHQSGAAVNNLTADRLTDMGNQAAYYDCLCRIKTIT